MPPDPSAAAAAQRTVDLVTRDFARWRSFFPLIRTGAHWAGTDLESEFEGRICRRTVGGIGVNVMSVRSRTHAIERTQLHVRSRPENFLLAAVQLSGASRLTTAGAPEPVAVLRPGDHLVTGWHRPSQWLFQGEFSLFVVRVPRQLLEFAIGEGDRPLGVVLASRAGAGALLTPFVHGLASDMDALAGAGGPRLVRALVELFGASMLESAAGPEQVAPDVFALATATMEGRLADPGLRVAEIARAAGVSPRHLQDVFARRGTTPTAWLRERRLESARRALADPAEHRPIARVAAEWGFPNAAHFSRRFRHAYGDSPSRVRGSGAVSL